MENCVPHQSPETWGTREVSQARKEIEVGKRQEDQGGLLADQK